MYSLLGNNDIVFHYQETITMEILQYATHSQRECGRLGVD
jgi:hypothetical protein